MESSPNSDTVARKFVWKGSIPLQVHLHESEVTSIPPPPPVLVLAPRNSYLPLLAPTIKAQFQSSLPPGTDTVWFEYNGLPLKWHIPTGVLFDVLCAEPERPWNLIVHFRGYPTDLLSPCSGEENVKWSFINSLKEASYIINGNTRNVMNMSQADQRELWRCVIEGDMDGYYRVSNKLNPSPVSEESSAAANSGRGPPHAQNHAEADNARTNKTGRIPIRLYVRKLEEGLEDLSDASSLRSWSELTYMSRPVEIPKSEGSVLRLGDALALLLPELFPNHLSKKSANPDRTVDADKVAGVHRAASVTQCSQGNDTQSSNVVYSEGQHDSGDSESSIPQENNLIPMEENYKTSEKDFKVVRIQGIEPSLDLPLSWIAQNLAAPDHFIYICIHTMNAEMH